MFNDPLNLTPIDFGNGPDGTGTNVPLALLPSFDPGKTVRVGTYDGLKATLTILHGTTKENKPYGTDRVSIRLDLTKVDDEGVTVTAFAQLVIGYPKAAITLAQVNGLVGLLASLALFGPDATNTSTFNTEGVAFLTRMKAGEG